MDGAEEFLSLADEVKGCQNKQTLVECKEEDYLKKGSNKCHCVPFHLRSFSREVRNYIILTDNNIGFQTIYTVTKIKHEIFFLV